VHPPATLNSATAIGEVRGFPTEVGLMTGLYVAVINGVNTGVT
jgi:hypothetical protein